MSRLIINIGESANDGTGDDARDGGAKINANFAEVYTRLDELDTKTENIDYSEITGKPILGSAASRNVGTDVGNLVEVLTGGKLPALDGSNLTNLPSSGGGGGGGGNVSNSGTPTGGQFARWTDATHVEGVTLDTSMVGGLGDAATKNTGTSAGNVVEVQSGGKLPVLDASNVTGLSAANVTGIGTAATKNTGTAVGNVVEVQTGGKLPTLDGSNLTNITSGNITGLGTAATKNTGTTTGNVVEVQASSKLPVLDGSNLTGITSSQVGGLGTAATRNVGTAANNVIALDNTAKLPAVDGSQLTNLPTGSGLPTGGTTGQVLKKNSNTNGDAGWANEAGGVPTSRTINTGTGLTGGGDLTANRTIELDSTTQASLAKADAAIPATPVAFRTALEVAVGDATQGPLIATAIETSLTDRPSADVLNTLNELAIGAKVSLLVVPYVDDNPQTITEKGVPVVENQLASNLWSADLAEMADITQDPNSFWLTDGNGDAYTASPSATYPLWEGGRPYTSRIVNINGSNDLSFSYQDGRRIISSVPAANFTLKTDCWNGLTELSTGVELIVPVGTTGYTMAIEAMPNGLYPYGATFPLALTASKRHKFVLSKEDGNVPVITYLGSGTPVESVVSFITNTYITGATPTMPTHQVGDLLVAYAINAGGSAIPALPAGWTDSGLTQDGNPPTMRVCWKIATSTSETSPTFTNTQKSYMFQYRKTVGSPVFGGVYIWETTSFAAGNATWPEITLTSKGIVAGVHQLRGTDTGALRADLPDVPNPDPNAGGASKTYAGVTTLQNVGTWPSSTSTKSGTQGQHSVVEFVVY